MDDIILKVEGLSKTFRSQWAYRPITAVKNVSFQVHRGEAFGFLGHNGAGKTTSLKCILGLIHKTSGRVELDGEELTSCNQLRSIGYLPEQPYFYDHLTVDETLEFFAHLHDIKKPERKKRVNEVLDVVGLVSRRRSPIRSMSKGMQQRLGLAQAIINRPKLLFLDEPFSGLDPLGRIEFREIFFELKNKGCSLILSSHILSDIEDLCERVAILADGEVRSTFALVDVPGLFGECFELILSDLEGKVGLVNKLTETSSKHEIEATNFGTMHIFGFSDLTLAQSAMELALAAGARIHNFQLKSLSLEDIFLSITRSHKEAVEGSTSSSSETRRAPH